MRALLRTLGSTRVTPVLGALLAASILAAGPLDALGAWRLAIPFALLALHLAAAIAAYPALRRGGLGVFHVALLVAIGLAAYSRLAHFSGRVEIVEGSAFDADAVDVQSKGPWHDGTLAALRFVQGPWAVDYRADLRRAHTTSIVYVADRNGTQAPHALGDDTPLALDGYRFYTSHNKGFAVLIRWFGDDGSPVAGALHMPSYPRLEWKQRQTFAPAGAAPLDVELAVNTAIDAQHPWRLDPARVASSSSITLIAADGRARVLRPGETVRLAGGTLAFDGVRGWMGYTIAYDPALAALIAIAAIGVAGLGWHVVMRNVVASRAGKAARAPFAGGEHA